MGLATRDRVRADASFGEAVLRTARQKARDCSAACLHYVQRVSQVTDET